MREGWKTIPFEKSIQKVKYTTKIPSSEYLPQGLFPIVSQEEGLISGFWDNDADVFHHNKPVVIFGDHTRIIKYVDFDFVLGADGVKILLPVEGLSAKFLSYYLRWYKVPSLGYSRHFKLLKEASVPLPPIAEQKRIVAELDCLTGIIEKKKQQLEELDKLAQSIFYEMFGDPITNEKGWKVKKLGDLCEVITKGTTPSSLGFSFVEEGINFLKVESFNSDETLNEAKIFHITKECDAALRRSRLEANDILMCIAGATCGRLAIVPSSVIPANTNQAFGIIRLKDKEQSFHRYIYSFLHSSFIRESVNDLMKGVAQPNLTLAHLRGFSILLPPTALQNEFAQKIEGIEKQKELVKRSIVETETLFNSRMDFWFN